MNAKAVPVGAKVTFRIAGQPFVGRVLQDRGPIGVGGRHLYEVRYEVGRGNWQTNVLPAVEIESIEYKPAHARRSREVRYITPFQGETAHSVYATPKHARPLAAFLRSREVPFTEDAEAIAGEICLLVDPSTPWDNVVALVDEWKREYAEGSTAPVAAGALR